MYNRYRPEFETQEFRVAGELYMRKSTSMRTIALASTLMLCMIFMARQAVADTYYVDLWPGVLRISGVNDEVLEGSTGTLQFIVSNISASSFTLNLSLNPTVGTTTGDPGDWAKFTSWGTPQSGTSCWANPTVAVGGACVLLANYFTDVGPDFGPPADGTTPFLVTVNLVGTPTVFVTRTESVLVDDVSPEPGSLLLAGTGLIAILGACRRMFKPFTSTT